jgi:hypothetical protein
LIGVQIDWCAEDTQNPKLYLILERNIPECISYSAVKKTNINVKAAVSFNTLWTGDADLHLYITPLQDS